MQNTPIFSVWGTKQNQPHHQHVSFVLNSNWTRQLIDRFCDQFLVQMQQVHASDFMLDIYWKSIYIKISLTEPHFKSSWIECSYYNRMVMLHTKIIFAKLIHYIDVKWRLNMATRAQLLKWYWSNIKSYLLSTMKLRTPGFSQTISWMR